MALNIKKQQGIGLGAVVLVLLIAALVVTIYMMMNSESRQVGQAGQVDRASDATATQSSDNSSTVNSDSGNSFTIHAVRVFDGQQVHEKQTVLVTDGLITAMGESLEIPEGLPDIDGNGKTLLPGLIDSHVHAFGTARQDALRFGVTSAIDLFTEQSQLAGFRAQREQIDKQDVTDIYSAGTLVTAPGGHGTQFGMSIPTLDNAADADAFVAARQAEGSYLIKVVYENGSEYGGSIPTLDRETLIAVIDAAKKRGLLSIVHISTMEFAKHALEAGADGLAHIFSDQQADQAFIDLARQHNAFIVPTLAVQASVAGRSQINHWLDRTIIAEQLSPMQLSSLNTTFPNTHAHVTDNVLATVASLYAAGIRILAGSDAPNPGTAHGLGLHQELWWLTQAGLSPQQALQAATADIADTFNLSDRGRIASGLRADLVLVDGNPLSDIDATLDIAAVWKDGYRVANSSNAVVVEQPAEQAKNYQGGLLDNFESVDSDGFQVRWQITTDQIMGGQSEAVMEPRIDESSGGNHYLHVAGKIMPGSMFPWAGVITFVDDEPMAAVDASEISTIEFRGRGQPGQYQLMVFSGAQSNTMPAIQQITLDSNWQMLEIDLNEINGVDLKRLRAFAWTAGPGHDDFEFALDDIELQ